MNVRILCSVGVICLIIGAVLSSHLLEYRSSILRFQSVNISLILKLQIVADMQAFLDM